MRFLSFALALATAVPTGRPHDVNGWQTAVWGMTEEQVLASFKANIVRTEPEQVSDCPSALAILGYEVSHTDYRVLFCFNSAHRLDSVVLTPPDNLSGKPHHAEFEILELLLREKYGQPSFSDDRQDGNVRERIWFFRKTTINLNYMVLGGADRLFLVYSPPNDERNKL